MSRFLRPSGGPLVGSHSSDVFRSYLWNRGWCAALAILSCGLRRKRKLNMECSEVTTVSSTVNSITSTTSLYLDAGYYDDEENTSNYSDYEEIEDEDVFTNSIDNQGILSEFKQMGTEE